MVARLFRTNYVCNITGLGSAFQETGIIRKLVSFLYSIALKSAKTIFFENSENCKQMLEYGICKKTQAYVLNGAGVNTEYFDYCDYPYNNHFRFLFIGRIMREKGIDELFSAMQELHRNGYDCVLDVVGPYEENYYDRLTAYNNMGWLYYYGSQKDVRPFIAQSDCFVLPSWHEGMANTNLESAASGRPVITSNIPGCKEAVIDGVSGFLCKQQDATDLYLQMKKMLLLDRSKRIEMGKSGRIHMVQNFEKKVVVNNTIKNLELIKMEK